jgi:alpha-tubulin suppressor-like RCC1 family protein
VLNPTHFRAVVMVVAVASSACVPVFRHADDASTVADAAQPDVTVLDVGPDRASVEEDVASVDVTSPADVVDAAQPAAAQAPLDTICAGDGFSCAIVDSRVRCWGRNDFFQTGNGNTNMGRCDDSSTSACPVRVVDAIKDRNAVQVACGAQFACALISGGDVYCWGRNEERQLGPNSSNPMQVGTRVGQWPAAQRIVAGRRHACVALGSVVHCWGANSQEQLGGTLTAANSATPIMVVGLPRSPVIELRAGLSHTIARLSDNSLWGWGTDSHGQLDRLTTDSGARRIMPPVGPTIGAPVALAAAWALTCVATTSDTLCGGSNAAGELGRGEAWLSPMRSPLSAAGLAASGALLTFAAGGGLFGGDGIRQHVCGVGVRSPRQLTCWGNHASGQLGPIPLMGQSIPFPSLQMHTFSAPVVGLAAGIAHSCARLQSGEVHCWGSNTFGESAPLNPMNMDPPASVPTPTPVSFP